MFWTKLGIGKIRGIRRFMGCEILWRRHLAGFGDQKRGRDAPATAAETAALLEAA